MILSSKTRECRLREWLVPVLLCFFCVGCQDAGVQSLEPDPTLRGAGQMATGSDKVTARSARSVHARDSGDEKGSGDGKKQQQLGAELVGTWMTFHGVKFIIGPRTIESWDENGWLMVYPQGEYTVVKQGLGTLRLSSGKTETFVYRLNGSTLELGFQRAGFVEMESVDST